MLVQGVLKSLDLAGVCLLSLLSLTFAPVGHGRRLLTGPSRAQLTVNATLFRDGDIVQAS